MFNVNCISAQVVTCDSFTLQFVENFGGTNSEVAYGIVATDDGGTMSIGHSLSRNGDVSDHFFNTDYWVVKTDGSGSLEWERSYGGNSADAGKAIVKDRNGDFVLCGYSISSDGDLGGTNGFTDYWIVKIDANGDIIWQKNYGGSRGENAYSIAEAEAGGYVIFGTSASDDIDVPSNAGDADDWILKIDTDGNIEWSKIIGGSEIEVANQIIQSPDGGFVGIGSSKSSDGDIINNNGDADIIIFKLNSSGNLLWLKTIGGSLKDDGNSISNTSDGGFIVSGVTQSSDNVFENSNGDNDAWAAKLDANGNVIWIHTYGGTGKDGAFGIVESPFGGYYFSCYSASSDGDFLSNNGLFDNWLVHLNQFGEIDWKKQFNGSASEEIKHMSIDKENLLFCGYIDSDDGESGVNQGESDYYVIRYATADYPQSDLKISETACEGSSVLFDATDDECSGCSYTWDDGNENASRNIIAESSKKYTVTISNVEGCSIQKSIDILVSNLDIQTEIIQPNQCGRKGSVELIPSGQIGIPKFVWADGNTFSSRANLSEGDHAVTVSDDICNMVSDFNIHKVGEIPVLNLGISKEVCGESTIDLDASSPDATYLWNTGNINPTIKVDQSGTYAITVTSAEGCSVVDSIDVAILGVPNLDLGEDFSSCSAFDLNTNLVGMNYEWSTGLTTPTIHVNTTDVYKVTVTNNVGCSSTDEIEIEISNDLDIELGDDVVSCDNVLLNSGLSNATYNWSSGETSQFLSVTESGEYFVTVTDGIGCSDADSIQITILPKIDLELGDNKAVCGSRIIDARVEAEKYEWSTGAIESEIFVEHSGNYGLTVTNSEGCSSVDEIRLVIKPVPVSNLQDSIYSCESISIDAGDGNYSFLWASAQNTSEILIETSGLYVVTITTDQGCKMVDSSYVSINDNLEVAESINHITCHDSNDGIISVLALGGKKPITYNWGVHGNTASIQNLPEGIYTLNITDSEGCTSTKSYKIHNPNGVVFDLETENFECNGATGQLISNIHGGTAPYSILWGNGETTENIEISESQWYSVSVTDGNQCEFKDSLFAEPSNPILVDTAIVVANFCEGQSTGSIEVLIKGGVEPHEYLWNTEKVTSKIDNLPAGNYSLTVNDPNGCSDEFEFLVKSLPGLDANLQGVNSCGGNTSWAFVQPTGGLAPYDFEWSNGDSTNQISNLLEGTYAVTITDTNGCINIDEVSVENYPQLIIKSTVTPISCYNEKDGKIYLSIESGTEPFSYRWSSDIIGENDLSNLDTGTYTIFMSDINGCSIFESIEISQPELLFVNVNRISPTDNSNGKIVVNPGGGTPPFSILWSDGATTMTIEDLDIGSYSFELTDAHDCSVSKTVNLTTGTDDISLFKYFKVLPNPNTGNFVLDVESFEKLRGEVFVTNVLGEKIWETQVSGNQFQIPISLDEKNNGIYFVHYEGENGQKVITKMVLFK